MYHTDTAGRQTSQWGCVACGMGHPSDPKLLRRRLVAEERRSLEGAGSGWLTCRRGAVINFGNLAL